MLVRSTSDTPAKRRRNPLGRSRSGLKVRGARSPAAGAVRRPASQGCSARPRFAAASSDFVAVKVEFPKAEQPKPAERPCSDLAIVRKGRRPSCGNGELPPPGETELGELSRHKSREKKKPRSVPMSEIRRPRCGQLQVRQRLVEVGVLRGRGAQRPEGRTPQVVPGKVAVPARLGEETVHLRAQAGSGGGLRRTSWVYGKWSMAAAFQALSASSRDWV